jgi:hypothetical protein
MIDGELRIEHQYILVATERHSVRVQESNGCDLVPYEIVPEPVATCIHEVGRKGLSRRKDDGASWREKSTILFEKDTERDAFVPGAVSDAIGEVAEDEVYAPFRKQGHDAKTVAVDDAIYERAEDGVHDDTIASVVGSGFKSCEGV